MDEITLSHAEETERLMAFYEFHDSILESLEWNGTTLTCVLNAVYTVSNQEKPLVWGRQRLQLSLEQAEISGEKAEPTIWLLDGKLECESHDTSPIDQLGVYDIPASLVQAQRVRISLFGENEDTHEFPRFEIRGNSMLVRKFDRVEWSEKHLRADLEQMNRIALAQKAFEPASDPESCHS